MRGDAPIVQFREEYTQDQDKMTTENEYDKKLVDAFYIKRLYSKAEKMAPCTGELLCKHEDLSLSSQYPHRNAGS